MINLEKYSYLQIIIFIKLLISQYNKFKSKLKFIIKHRNEKNEIEKIEDVIHRKFR